MKIIRRPRWLLSPVVLVWMALVGISAGCGGDSPKAASADTATTSVAAAASSVADLARQYQEVAAPINAAQRLFTDKLGSLPGGGAPGQGATSAQVADVAEPFAGTLRDYVQKLARLPWPESMRAHADALITALSTWVDELMTIRQQKIFIGWTNEVSSKINAAVTLLRADLGLPPPGEDTTTTTVRATK